MKTISLLFEFTDLQGNKQPVFFTQPRKIITAYKQEEVLLKFSEVQIAVDAGYYAAGYVSYEAAPAFDGAFTVNSETKMPLLWFGIFENPSVYEETEKDSFLLSDWKSETSKEKYEEGFQRIKDEIRKGNTYQVNHTLRLQSHFSGDDFAFYKQLTNAQDSSYSAYLNTGRFRILSASPELFFHWKENQLITRPMKGTVNRGINYEQDIRQAEWLAHSAKNQAENVMIVDLLRNDVSVVAENGSVHVSALFEVEKYPTVWQMTSTVQAQTKCDTTVLDIFKALFPCGSITGAPKVKTMEIISTIETSPREVYCGAVGYITPNREAIFNVPIRTVWIDEENGLAEYGVGGGITWDSKVNEEYSEAFLKAKLLTTVRPEFQLLESLRLENGQYFLLEHHLERLMHAADYFHFPLNKIEVQSVLIQFANEHPKGVYKVRLIVSKSGGFEINGQQITEIKSPVSMKLANFPIETNHPFVYFKTTNRSVYEPFQKLHSDFFDVLLWNDKGEITEFTNGNVVMKINGVLYTPPPQCGLLAGTFRQELLGQKKIKEKVLTKSDLPMVEEIWFINSVRKWLKVDLMI